MVVSRRVWLAAVGSLLALYDVGGAGADRPRGLAAVPGVAFEVIDVEDPVPVGETATYLITATNQGLVPQSNMKVVVTYEREAEYVCSGGATKGNLWSTGVVAFEPLPLLAPKAKATWQVVLKAVKPGDVRFAVSTTSGPLSRPVKETEATTFYAASDATATKPPAIPAVRLEMSDVEDPVAVGNTATYVITATNQGTVAQTHIKIAVVLESNVQYVSSEGATEGTSKKVKKRAAVVFSPLPNLAPRAKADWRVAVKAAKPGDVRFFVSLTSDQLRRPVKETEATTFYLPPAK